MHYHKLAPLAALAVLALAGCKGEQKAPEASPSDVAATALPPSEAASQPAKVLPTEIPEVIRGRWGLVPADCTSTRGDNKGLVTIDAKSMKFYESRALLEKVNDADDDGLKATFGFTGEGQTWKLDVALEVEGDHNEKLFRKDTGPDAAPGTLEYTRCLN
jgi:hypothetical protein